MMPLTIVQPYVPRYRVDFFNMLDAHLARAGIRLRVLAAAPTGAQALRRDVAQGHPWMHEVSRRELSVGGRRLVVSTSARHWPRDGGVIVGLEGSSFEMYRSLIWSSRSAGRRLGLWGHVKPYVSRGNAVDLALERFAMRRADQIFAYTRSGAEFALRAGISRDRVTTVMNSMSVDGLVKDVTAAARGGSGPAHLLFVGGIDEAKRITFIVDVLDRLWERGNRTVLKMAGRGNLEHLLIPASSRGQVELLGYQDSSGLRQAANGALGILNPGRIGLIAIQALALQLPIFTTAFPYHAPESEYLREGESRFTLPDEPFAFAAALEKHIQARRSGLLLSEWTYPTVDDMVDNFSAGVMNMMTRASG